MFIYCWAMPNMPYTKQVKPWRLYKDNYCPNEAVWRMEAAY